MPRFLLDTHVFLWWVNDDPNLMAAARMAISNGNNECYLSMASCWEMAIKSSLGKLRLARPIERFVSDHSQGQWIFPFERRVAPYGKGRETAVSPP